MRIDILSPLGKTATAVRSVDNGDVSAFVMNNLLTENKEQPDALAMSFHALQVRHAAGPT